MNDDDFLDRDTVRRRLGGTAKPLHASTLYRGIKAGRYPKPVHVGPGSSRWLRSEVEACRTAMVEGRAA